jgi:hypothetical protein
MVQVGLLVEEWEIRNSLGIVKRIFTGRERLLLDVGDILLGIYSWVN